jgi:plastocyanin
VNRPARTLAGLAAVALVAAACGEDTPGTPGQSAPPAAEVTVVAQNTAFDLTNLDAQAGQQLAITFDNRDEGIQHNLHVSDTASGDAETEITEGPVTQELTVQFDQPGTFDYTCDVHPDQMRGTITVDG